MVQAEIKTHISEQHKEDPCSNSSHHFNLSNLSTESTSVPSLLYASTESTKRKTLQKRIILNFEDCILHDSTNFRTTNTFCLSQFIPTTVPALSLLYLTSTRLITIPARLDAGDAWVNRDALNRRPSLERWK